MSVAVFAVDIIQRIKHQMIYVVKLETRNPEMISLAKELANQFEVTNRNNPQSLPDYDLVNLDAFAKHELFKRAAHLRNEFDKEIDKLGFWHQFIYASYYKSERQIVIKLYELSEQLWC